jgi:hypothetical protein
VGSRTVVCPELCEASHFEEPRAVVPHAGICAGAAGQLAVLPRWGKMEPIDFLLRVEPMTMRLFESYRHARIAAENERWVLVPQKQYYAYIFEHRASIEECDDETLKHNYGKLAGVHKALLLADVAAGAVAGAILQVARQCVSIAWPAPHGRMEKGRMVGKQHLSSVIWHARNQSLHFEEGMPTNSNTKKSVQLLSEEYGIQIDNLSESPRSLAVEVFEILEWSSYENYAKDMVEMLKVP